MAAAICASPWPVGVIAYALTSEAMTERMFSGKSFQAEMRPASSAEDAAAAAWGVAVDPADFVFLLLPGTPGSDSTSLCRSSIATWV